MKLEFKNLKKIFNDTFGEYNNFDMALDAIVHGLNDGKSINHSRARLFYEGPVMSLWAYAEAYDGYIFWKTGSNHTVKFCFVYDSDFTARLRKVQVGDDASEYFYGEIEEICRKNKIDFEKVSHDELSETVDRGEK